MNKNLKIILVAGARPNFMKVSPLIHAINKHNKRLGSKENKINCILVHTGQHYDIKMSEIFFSDLVLPRPDINLEVGSASHAIQTAKIMTRFEKVCIKENPDWILVVGDVNSTIACTLVAAKLGIKVGHVEAGLRSFDRSMPEEINRIVTDALSDLLFTPSEDADKNLMKEGISKEKIKRVGNIMIDTLIANLDKARQLRPHDTFGLNGNGFVYVTLHRPSNVDNRLNLSCIMECLIKLSHDLPVIFSLHPRTKKQLISFGLLERINNIPSLFLTEPLSYHNSIGLIDKARFVLTDSGGIQEETTFLKIPCLTLRPNTERPITISQGTNKLTSPELLEQDIEYLLNGNCRKGEIPELWDGKTGKRIIRILTEMGAYKKSVHSHRDT